MELETAGKQISAFAVLRIISLCLSAVLIITGGLGLIASLLFFTSRAPEDLVLAGSGLLAGSILIGSGVISFALGFRSVECR